MITELENGEVDLLHKCVEADAISAGMGLVGNSQANVANYARSGYSFISYSCEQPAMESKAVRQAIAHCFDKDEFVSEYVKNYGTRVEGYYGIGQWMYQMVAGSLMVPEIAEEDEAKAEEESARWENLTLENIRTYEADTEAAVKLLEEDGWVLNSEGGAYDREAGGARCKEINGELVSLEVKMIYPEGNEIGEYAAGSFAAKLKEAGIELEAEGRPFEELLKEYYLHFVSCTELRRCMGAHLTQILYNVLRRMNLSQ